MDLDIAYKETRALKIELKKAIVKEINTMGLGRETLRKKLGLLPSGVDILFSHDYWPIEKAMSIIKHLNLKTRLIIGHKQYK